MTKSSNVQRILAQLTRESEAEKYLVELTDKLRQSAVKAA